MSTQVLTALISGVVALVVAGGSGFLTWAQIRRERNKWQIEVKTAYALELHKARLASYPEVFRILFRISHGPGGEATPETAGEVAQELNSWFYSTGGMCADATTRGAIIGLRSSLDRWSREGGRRPREIYEFRNLALAFLRRDLDVGGLESYDFEKPITMLEKLKAELETMNRNV
jgi:hypothetical protein